MSNTTPMGTWGQFYSALESLSFTLQNTTLTNYDLAFAGLSELDQATLTQLNSATQRLATHQAREDNPHQVDKFLLGYGNVDNYATATLAQASDITRDDLFITPQGYGSLAQGVFGSFAATLHHQGISPISSFGTISFLPPDVSGSFEGSGMADGRECSPMNIEDDGTLVGLRYGTTGTSEGLYYFYLTNAEDRIDSTPPIRTNYKYTPASLPAGTYCGHVRNSDPAVLFGELKGSSSVGWWVSLTNGTFDVTKHYTAYFSTTGLGIDDFLLTNMYACIAGAYVYLFGSYGTYVGGQYASDGSYIFTNTTPIDFFVGRIPVAAIQAGGTVTLELVKNWSSKTLWGNTVTTTHVRLSQSAYSTNASDKPMLLVNNANKMGRALIFTGACRTHACVNPSNPNQIRVLSTNTANVLGHGGQYANAPFTVSVVLDLAAKTSTPEDGATYMTGDVATANLPVITGPTVLPLNTLQTYGYGIVDGFWPNDLVTQRGYVFTRATGNQPDENTRFSKVVITNFVSRFDALRVINRQAYLSFWVGDPLVTGSDVTNSLVRPQLLPGMQLLFAGTARNHPNLTGWQYGNLKLASLVGNPTFAYHYLSGVTVNGWAPNSQRQELPSPIDTRLFWTIQQVDSAGTISVSNTVVNSSPDGVGLGVTVNADLSITGAFSWNQTEFDTLVSTVATSLMGTSNLTAAKGQLYVPQDVNVPLLLVVGATKPNGSGYLGKHAVYELNYTGARTGLITGYSVKKQVVAWDIQGLLSTMATGQVVYRFGENTGLVIYKTAAGDYLLGIGSFVFFGLIGSGCGSNWYAAIRAGTGTIETSTVKSYYGGYYPNDRRPTPIAIPGYGMCMTDFATSQANGNAAIIVDSMAVDYAGFLAWTSRAKLTLIAQQVEQGWLVYFTSPTPIFLAGNEYTLAPGNIDLRDIQANPANTTFYIYVELVNEVAVYRASATALAPTMTLMYIGVVTTNSSQIASIVISKKIRIDTFELSATRIGSGIPITTGVPSLAGSFAWRNGLLKLAGFSMELDYTGTVSVNLRTGLVTIAITPRVGSYTNIQTIYSTGETWAPGLIGTQPTDGSQGDLTQLISTSKTFAALAKGNIASFSTIVASVGNEVAPQPSTITQPTAANDYTFTWTVTDGPGGNQPYSFDLYVHYQ